MKKCKHDANGKYLSYMKIIMSSKVKDMINMFRHKLNRFRYGKNDHNLNDDDNDNVCDSMAYIIILINIPYDTICIYIYTYIYIYMHHLSDKYARIVH